MFDTKEKARIPAKFLFLICAAIGAVCFIGIYGIRILDFANVDWLFDNDHDLRQHFIGWCRYRSDPWHFPIGLIDSLSYPNSMSVIYTDSIPLFAVFFKLLSPILPVNFQYFGLFGILSFALMGGFSSILLRRIVNNDIVCIAGSVFYVTASPVIQRIYYHTALSAQWIVVACLVLFVCDELIPTNRQRIIYWGIAGFICVGIHSYFLPMAGMILAATAYVQIVRKRSFTVPLLEFVSFSAAGLVNLFILGGFYGGTSPVGPGLGTFGSNLNTFINPQDIGHVLPELPVLEYFQYEGMAYLGAGILFLFLVTAAGMVFRMIRSVPEEAFHSDAVFGRAAIALTVVSFLAATLPKVSFNDKLIFDVPYPHFVKNILGIFRSNGRLVWPAMYVLMTAAIAFCAYTFRRYSYVAVIVTAAALLLQVADMSETFAQKYAFYTAQHPAGTLWDDEELAAFAQGCGMIAFLYTENDITLETGYYGYIHNVRQNNFYFARDIDDKVREGIDTYLAGIDSKDLSDGVLYVVRKEDYENDRNRFDASGAAMIEKNDHIFMKKK